MGEPSAGKEPSAGGEPSANGEPSADGAAQSASVNARTDLPQDPLVEPEPGASGEPDPLMPESDEVTASDSEIFADSDAEAADSQSTEVASTGEPSAGGEPSADGEPSAGGEPSTSGDPAEEQSAPTMAGGGTLSDEIRAAQEALIEAGIELQTAGDTLQTATSDAELAAAEAALGRARIAVIVAGEAVISARENGSYGDENDLWDDAEGALNDANTAIVIATNTLLSSRIELPDIQPGGQAGGKMGELDKELEESLIIFEGEILAARRAVIDGTPPPKSNESIPGGTGSVSIPGSGEDEPMEPGDMSSSETQQGRLLGDKEVTLAGSPPLALPEDIPDPQGDDIVAQQLREAAIAESDPDLQAKLWEEYKRYRAGL